MPQGRGPRLGRFAAGIRAQRIRDCYRMLVRGDSEGLVRALTAGRTLPCPPAAQSAIPVHGDAAESLHRFAQQWDDLLLEPREVRQAGEDCLVVAGTLLGRPAGAREAVYGWFRHTLWFSDQRLTGLQSAVGSLSAPRGVRWPEFSAVRR